MSTSKKLLQGSMVLAVGRVAGYGLSFVRNLILARALAKADYGLAAVFGMALTLLEISGRMAFGQQIIQSKKGDNPAFQASAHALQFIGGLCSALVIAGMSVPIARLFGVPHTWWAFAVLAVVPLSQGLSHLDIARYQRNLEYGPLVLVDVVPQFLITLAAWPLALWLRDFRVIVWLIIGKAILGCALSFALARWSYRWAWDRENIRSMLSFGWPLLLTGLVMFGSSQADQMIVGAAFSLGLLANYALAASLVSIPWFIFAQVGSSLMLPLMSRAQDDPERLRRQYRRCVQIAAVVGIICIMPLMVAGEQMIRLLFGAKYQGTGVFVALLGAGFAVRFLRYAPAEAAIARADTVNELLSNLWRGTSLPLALGVWSIGGTPAQIAGCAVAGEILATLASVLRLWRRQGVPLGDSYGAGIYVAGMVSIGLAIALLGGADLSIWWALLLAVGAFAVAISTAWLMFPEVASIIAAARRQAGTTAASLLPT
jgi:O-antigen/teichoic acid export membrane protein